MSENGGHTTPAGWYPDPQGAPDHRWWDGTQWTDATQPQTATPGSQATAQGESAPASASRPWHHKKRFILPVGTVIGLIFGIVIGGAGSDDQVVEDVGEDAGLLAQIEALQADNEALQQELAEAETAPESAPESTPAPEPEPDDQDEAAEQEAALGTRVNPLEPGTEIELADWILAVTDVTHDAADAIAEANSFNDPPEDGYQYVMFHVEATYIGNDSGDPWLDFSWAIIGDAGNTFTDSCGVTPTNLRDQGETYPDGSVSGNQCIAIAADQLEDATIRVQETLSFDDSAAFYKIQ